MLIDILPFKGIDSLPKSYEPKVKELMLNPFQLKTVLLEDIPLKVTEETVPAGP